MSHPWVGHFFARLSFGVGHLMIFTMVEAREDCAGWDSFIGWADLRRGGTDECRVGHFMVLHCKFQTKTVNAIR